jgi:hypothetical protein
VDRFGPCWRGPGGETLIFVVTSWGVGILSTNYGPPALIALVALEVNQISLGGWNLDTTNNNFGSLGNYDGGAQTEIFVTSPWGIGILQPTYPTLTATMLQPNGTRLGYWLLNTSDDIFF